MQRKSIPRRKCPGGFTAAAVFKALQNGKLGDEVTRIKEGMQNGKLVDNLFVVDLTKTQDREGCWRYKDLLSQLLLANPSGIMRTTVLREGLRLFEAENGRLFKGSSDKFRTESWHISHLMSTLKDINKNRVTGERLPMYVNDLLLLLEDWHPSDGDTAGSDKSEEVDTSQAQVSIPSSFAGRGSSTNLDKHTEMVQLRMRHPGRRLLKKEPSQVAETEYFPSDAEGAKKEAEGGEGEQPDQPPENPKPHFQEPSQPSQVLIPFSGHSPILLLSRSAAASRSKPRIGGQ